MHPISIADLRRAAKKRLPRFVFDYLDGGSDDEVSLAGNRTAFAGLRLLPRALVDVSVRDTGIDWAGARLPAPLIIAPTGMNGLFWRQGDIALAKAARRHGLPFTLSTASSDSLEEVAREAGGDIWFQLYVMDRRIADGLVDRAEAAGCSHLVLTVDVPLGGLRERDRRNGFAAPFRLTPRLVADVLAHPHWLMQVGRHGAPPMGNLEALAAADPVARATLLSRAMDASFGWDDLKRLRDRWPRRLIVKGLLDPEDVARAEAAGVDAVVLSNHGGRQLDGAPAPVAMLPAARARSTLPLVVDSGIRRGSDVVKALALGASAVMLGRAVLYGLAAGGEDGAFTAITLLRAELDRTLALAGRASLADLSPSMVLSD